MSQPISWTPHTVPNGGLDESVSARAIEPHRWAACRNVEPTPDSARHRPGSAASNAIPLQAVVESYTVGAADRTFADVGSEYKSQGFKLGSTQTISLVAVRVRVNAGAPTGTLECAIYNGAISPSGPVTGAGFANFNSYAASAIFADYRWFMFSLATGVSLTSGTQYHLALRHLAAVAGNTLAWETDAAGTYANGNLYEDEDDIGAWASIAANDQSFKIYSGNATITGIADYRLADAVNSFHLVAAGDSVYKNVGGVMTLVSGREKAGLSSSANNLVSWAVGQDRWLMTNGVDIGKKFYLLAGVEYWENEGIAAPTATPAAAGAAGALGAGPYEFDYFYWNNDIGQPSARRYQGVGALSHTLGAPGSIDITGLPATVVRATDRATHIRIECKFPGSTVFRQVGQITLGTTTFSLTTDTRTVDAEYGHQLPPVHTCKAVGENRQFIGNVAGFPYRLMFSDIVGATPYYESFPSNNFRDFGRGDGDYITALAFIPDRALIVGMRNSIWALDARRPGTSDAVMLARGVGIAGRQSFVAIGSRLYFVSDGDRAKGLYVLDGLQEPRLFRQIDGTFKTLSQGRLKYASCAHMAPGDNRMQVWTLLGTTSSNSDRVLVYDYALDAWGVYHKPAGRQGNVLGHIEASGVSSLYLGGTNGIEYRHDSGSSDAGTAYDSGLTFKAFDFGAEHTAKRMRFFDSEMVQQTAGSLALQVQADYGPIATATIEQMGSSGTFTLGTSTLGGTDLLGEGTQLRLNRTPIRLAGRILQPELSSDTGPWELRGMAIGVQPTGRR